MSAVSDQSFFVRKVVHYLETVPPPTIPDPHRLLTLVREALEDLQVGPTYPVLRLFCDWMVHTKLDRPTIQLLEMLTALNIEIAKSVGGTGTRPPLEVFARFGHFMAIPALRVQLRDFLESVGLAAPIADSYNGWNAFLDRLYHELLGKRIELPPSEKRGRVKDAYDEIFAAWDRHGGERNNRILTTVGLIYPDPLWHADKYGITDNTAGFRWEVVLSPRDQAAEERNIVIIVPVTQPEPPYLFREFLRAQLDG